MHPEVMKEAPGKCPKCGMMLIPKEGKMSSWEKFKMSMTMSMGMEHTGLAGREMAKMMEEDIRFKFFFSLILSIFIVAFSFLKFNSWLLLVLTTPVFFYSGWIFLYSTYKALQAKILNMAVLIAVGTTAAYSFSVVLTFLGSRDSYYEAAALLITFVLFGHWMEMKSRRGTTDALQALFALVPPQARILRNGKEELVATSEVKVGDILILKPGDKVPVDGEIISGETAIDESLVTGESIPVPKTVGDKIVGGSINQTGSVQFKAVKIGGDTVLAQIVKLVETAQNSKAPGQKIADRFAKYLVIVAVGGGLLTFTVWFFVMGQPLLFALAFAISTVVIACPDALGLATPTAVAVGTGLGAKHNILIKDAPTLEQVSKIQVVVLDKTGTLTEGKPRVTNIDGDVLQIAASLEKLSTHPLAKAILEKAEEQKIKLLPVTNFQNLAGRGIKGKIKNKEYYVGNSKLETAIIVSCGEEILGKISVTDRVKPSAKEAVEKMKAIGLEVIMITGDNEITAKEVAMEVGIERFFARVLPEDKEKYVKKLQDEKKFVAMVGDGVNDAPALAQADIGIAIGAGTDVAIETAKVVLMKSDPLDILRAIRLSKATVRKMKENLFWASIYNLSAIPVAAGMLYPKFGISLRPEIAALLMSISSIVVATNAVLLKRTEKDLINVRPQLKAVRNYDGRLWLWL
ncbi:cadmium-translocating P-type ATPase [Candidatus Gottesmanbacteria bacterium]|nr:cadmium-translocating P-type ATPase [Candidatus Gottesmanbacteria bacterium]